MMFSRAEMDKHLKIGRKKTSQIRITILFKQHFEKQNTFLMNVFMKSWQTPVINIIISVQNAAIALEKMTCHTSSNWLCASVGKYTSQQLYLCCCKNVCFFQSHFSSYDEDLQIQSVQSKNNKGLAKRGDETPQLACTLQLQHLNKKGGGENIVPQPGMKVVKKKTNLDEPNTPHGASGRVKCLLYEAQKQPKYNADVENVFLSELEKIDANLGSQLNKAKDPWQWNGGVYVW